MAFWPAVGGRIVKKLREVGPAGTVAALLRRLRQEVYSEVVSIIQLKDLAEIVPVRRPSGVVVEELRREHLPLLAELNRARDAPQVDERFRAYLDSGFKGFIALIEGKAAGYYWWVDAAKAAEFPDLRDFGFGIELGPGEVYGSDYYILEEHRNGRLASEILAHVETGLRERGYSSIWGYVLADNRPARWLYETRGYQRLWVSTRKRRLFLTRVSNTLDPRTERSGLSVER